MMNSDFKIIFVHGYTASSRENWYPAISEELEKLGIDFEVPDMPGGDRPHAEDWLNTIHDAVSKTEKPLIFVGHSLGTRAIILYLEKYQPKKVKAVFLIAGFANRTENATKYDGDGYPDFFVHKIDIEKVKKLSEKFVVIHSKDDDLHFEQAEEISEDLVAKLIPFTDKGHMSGPENAPVILEILRNEIGF